MESRENPSTFPERLSIMKEEFAGVPAVTGASLWKGSRRMKKTVLITGASRGIGRAAALRFAQGGYDLILACREQKAKLAEVRAEAEARGARCLTFAGDLSRQGTVDRLWDKLEAEGFSVDVLLSNAGTTVTNVLQNLTPEDWQRVMDTNLTPLFLLSRRAIPEMLKKGHGKILATSSVYGSVGGACEVAYSASKGAINGFVRALSKELAPSNIQVNAVAPGAIDTELIADIGEEGYARLDEEIPAGRLGRPEEVAEAFFFLAEAPAYVTGQILTVDGGWM